MVTEGLEIRQALPTEFSKLEELASSLGLSVDCGREKTLDQSRLLVATLGERLVGFSLFWIVAGEVELLDIGVNVAAQRSGIGSRLLAATLEVARKEGAERGFLEVRRSNGAAQRLYERAEFVFSYVRDRYYGDGEDALVYAIDLSK